MKKVILIVILVVVLLGLGGAGIYVINKNREEELKRQLEVKKQLEIQIANDFSSDLLSSFNDAVKSMNLPKESVTMADSYAGEMEQPFEKKVFEKNLAAGKQFYMASTIKPLILTGIIKLLNIRDLNYKIPFTFFEDEKMKGEIAQEVHDNITYNYPIDQFLVDYIVPFFKDKQGISSEEILTELLQNPKINKMEFTLKQLIQSTLGPSSNWSLLLIKDHLALVKYDTQEKANNAIENYLNKILKDNDMPGDLIINQSTNANDKKMFNTTYYYEAEYLFEWFYENKYDLDKDIFAEMKNAMHNVSIDPAGTNRSHEIKSMVKDVLGNSNADIVEKSGYIGLDFEAAPGLNAANGWDKLTQVDGKRIVFFDASIFSRIYLKSGEFVQFNYNISVPVYLSLDPHYEELNQDYLTVKNQILDKLRSSMEKTLTKYKDEINIVKS